jgi:hypothetical protein
VRAAVSSTNISLPSPSLHPLLPRKRAARARAAWKAQEDGIRIAFLTDIEALCAQAAEVRALDTLRAFHRDRLTYRREQVDQGLAEPDTLWSETEAAQQAEQAWQQAAAKLTAQRLTLARRYGGEAWRRLGLLLEGILKLKAVDAEGRPGVRIHAEPTGRPD